MINECFCCRLSDIDLSSLQVASDQLEIALEVVINLSDWLGAECVCVCVCVCKVGF